MLARIHAFITGARAKKTCIEPRAKSRKPPKSNPQATFTPATFDFVNADMKLLFDRAHLAPSPENAGPEERKAWALAITMLRYYAKHTLRMIAGLLHTVQPLSARRAIFDRIWQELHPLASFVQVSRDDLKRACQLPVTPDDPDPFGQDVLGEFMQKWKASRANNPYPPTPDSPELDSSTKE